MSVDKLLSPAEAAARLGVAPVTLRKWAQKGALPAHTTVGRHRRFAEADLARFAQEHGMTLLTPACDERRILIVEDDRQLSMFISEALATLDPAPEVDVAYDGFEAGRKLQRWQPHLVLLDLMLPGIDGFAICRALKDDPSTRAIRIVAMTGYDSADNVRRILAAGAEICLSKPFSTRELLAALEGDPATRATRLAQSAG